MEDYNYWMVWHINCEGDRRWFPVRCPGSWDSQDVASMARQRSYMNEISEVLEDEFEMTSEECWNGGVDWSEID